MLRFRAVINPSSARRHEDHEHRHGDVEQPAADRERERLDRRRRHPGRRHPERQGVARRELQPHAGSQRARARRLDRRAVSQRPAVAHACRPTRTACIASSGIPPNYITGEQYELRFTRAGRDVEHREARPGVLAAFTNGLQRISDIIVQFASNLQDLNLPIAPNGVAYNSVTRAPVAGVTLRLLSAGNAHAAAGGCFDDPAQQNQVTLVERLLPLRPELRRSGVPERRQLHHRRDAAADRLHRHVLADHSADHRARRLRAFSVPACPGGVDDALAGTAELLRSADLGVRADARRSARAARARATTCT